MTWALAVPTASMKDIAALDYKGDLGASILITPSKAESHIRAQAKRIASTGGCPRLIRHTSRASDRCAARAGRSNIGIFIKQKDD